MAAGLLAADQSSGHRAGEFMITINAEDDHA